MLRLHQAWLVWVTQGSNKPTWLPSYRCGCRDLVFKDRVSHNAQDYPDIITHSLCKYSSIIPAELSHSLFAVKGFVQSQHVTRGVPLNWKACISTGGFPNWHGWLVILQKSSCNFCRDDQFPAEGKHDITELNYCRWLLDTFMCCGLQQGWCKKEMLFIIKRFF